MGAERPPTAAGSSRTATTSTGSPPGSSTWGSSSPGGFGPFRRCPTLDPLGDRVRTAGPRAPPDATPRLADDARPGPGPAARRSVPMAGALEAEEATLRGTCPAPRGTTPAPPPRRARPAPGRDRIPEIPPSPRGAPQKGCLPRLARLRHPPGQRARRRHPGTARHGWAGLHLPGPRYAHPAQAPGTALIAFGAGPGSEGARPVTALAIPPLCSRGLVDPGRGRQLRAGQGRRPDADSSHRPCQRWSAPRGATPRSPLNGAGTAALPRTGAPAFFAKPRGALSAALCSCASAAHCAHCVRCTALLGAPAPGRTSGAWILPDRARNWPAAVLAGHACLPDIVCRTRTRGWLYRLCRHCHGGIGSGSCQRPCPSAFALFSASSYSSRSAGLCSWA
jgi:hypothetical protein